MPTTTEATEATVWTHTCDSVWEAAWVDKIAKTNRKIARNGLEPFRMAIVSREPRERRDEHTGVIKRWTETTFTVTGDSPSLPGWRFAATVDWEEAGPVVRTSPTWTRGPLPRPESRACDHCGTSRWRQQTFLVAGPDGAFKQVGRQCLTAFTGIPLGWVAEWDDLGGQDEDGWDLPRGEVTYDTASLLRLTISLVDARGYWKVDCPDRQRPTRSDFFDLWHGISPMASRWERERFEALREDIKRRARSDAEIEAEVEAILAWAATLDDSSDYLANLRVILGGERLSGKSVGYAVSAVPTFRRSIETKAKREATKAARTPLTAGRQVITGTIKSLKVVESQYGSTTKILVETDQGSAVWGSLPSALWNDAVIGKRLTFTAQVEVSKDDPGFGFYKRPTKPSWL